MRVITLSFPWIFSFLISVSAFAECRHVIDDLGFLRTEVEVQNKIAQTLLAEEAAKAQLLNQEKEKKKEPPTDRFLAYFVYDSRMPSDKADLNILFKSLKRLSGKSEQELKEIYRQANPADVGQKAYFTTLAVLSGQSPRLSIDELNKRWLPASKKREAWINQELAGISFLSGKPLKVLEEAYNSFSAAEGNATRLMLVGVVAHSELSPQEVKKAFNKLRSAHSELDRARLLMFTSLSGQPLEKVEATYREVFSKTPHETGILEMFTGRDTRPVMTGLARKLFGQKTSSVQEYASIQEMPIHFTINISGDVEGVLALGGDSDSDPYAGYRHSDGTVYYRNGSPYGGTVYYDRDGRAYDSQPRVLDTLVNRLRRR